MKLTPSTIALHVKSNAEKKVFNLLKAIDLGPQGICFHSLRLSDHYYKRMGEIDFLLLTNSGIFVLEVKGGDVKRDEKGIWTITDRNLKKHRKNESPFEQASSALYSLLTSLEEHVEGFSRRSLCFGYGVIFPDCVFDVSSVEWEPEMILDKRSFKSPSTFKASLQKLIKYWQSKTPSGVDLNQDQIKKISLYLRPQFDLAQSLGHRASEIEELMVTLTNQQIEGLDIIEANPRILCTGGAGTGKTFIAVEVARRLGEGSSKVLFVCKSVVLAAYVRTKLPPNVDVLAFKFIDTSSGKYDAIILDEGQDAINFNDLSLLDAILNHGLEKGTWRIFLDKNNQSGMIGSYEDSAFDMLKLYHPVEVVLTRNCRNTEPIVNAVRLLTASDIGVATAGKGPEVKYLYTFNEENAASILEDEIARLLQNEVSLGEISIISAKDFNNSIASLLSNKYKSKLSILTAQNVSNFPFHNISFSSVQDFKGLENRFIFMTDFTDSFIDKYSITPLYVGMTRARVSLTIILSEGVKSIVNKILIKNIALMDQKNKP